MEAAEGGSGRLGPESGGRGQWKIQTRVNENRPCLLTYFSGYSRCQPTRAKGGSSEATGSRSGWGLEAWAGR